MDKIITYAECLVTGDNQEISMTKYMSEMTHQFNLNSYYMITTIFDGEFFILYYTILYYSVLYCTILNYAIL